MSWGYLLLFIGGFVFLILCGIWVADEPDSVAGKIGTTVFWILGLGAAGLTVFAIVDCAHRDTFAKKASIYKFNVNQDEEDIRTRLRYLLYQSKNRIRIMSADTGKSSHTFNHGFRNCTGFIDTVTGERLEIHYRNVYVPGDENSDPTWSTCVDTITLRNPRGISPSVYKIDPEYLKDPEGTYRATVTDTMVQLIATKPFNK